MAETVSSTSGKTQALTAEDVGLLAGRGKPRRQNSLWGDAWRRLRKNKLALAGLVVVVFLCIIAIFAPVLAREPLDVQNYNALYAHPSRSYPMGADQLGRDILSRVIWGSRVSLLVGLGAQVIVLAVGVAFGATAGYFGGIVDQVLMRIVDVV